MAKPINIVKNQQIVVQYDDNYWFKARIKGLKDVFRACNVEDLPPQIQQIVLGKRSRLRMKRGCAARLWRNPLVDYDKRLEHKREEAERAAREEAKSAKHKAEKEAMIQTALRLLQKGSQQDREALVNYEWDIVFEGYMPDLRNVITRDKLKEIISCVETWRGVWEAFSKKPICNDMNIVKRAYNEPFTIKKNTLYVPNWIHQDQYLNEAKQRLNVLENLV